MSVDGPLNGPRHHCIDHCDQGRPRVAVAESPAPRPAEESAIRSHPCRPRPPRPDRWPGAIVPFLLGEVETADLTGAAGRAGNDILQQRWECQAHFYVALRATCEGDPATFRARMAKSAASRRGELEHEWYLARWEVERAFPDARNSKRRPMSPAAPPRSLAVAYARFGR